MSYCTNITHSYFTQSLNSHNMAQESPTRQPNQWRVLFFLERYSVPEKVYTCFFIISQMVHVQCSNYRGFQFAKFGLLSTNIILYFFTLHNK